MNRDSAPPTSETTRELVRALETLLPVCEKYGRPDLSSRLRQAIELVDKPGIHVVICGEFKQGKSTLVNALLSSNLCPVDDDIATAVPTFIRWAHSTSFEVCQFTDDPAVKPHRRNIAREEFRQYVVEQGADNPHTADRVDVEFPDPILADGLVIVDTPGVGGLGSVHAAATLASLALAEATIFVSDASQEYTETEMEFLRQAHGFCPNLVCVLTKTDLYPSWRKIRNLNVEHLHRAGLTVQQLAVSSALHLESVRTGDTDLRTEGGLAELEAFLRDQVTAGVRDRSLASAASELRSVVALLKTPFEGERAALADHDAAESIVQDLLLAKEESAKLISGSAEWSVTLSDATTDLMNDVEHDFRRRLRTVLDECSETIDTVVPADVWAEFEPWLYARVSAEVIATYAFLHTRSAELTGRVAEQFRDASGDIVEHLTTFNPKPVLPGIHAGAVNFEITTVGRRGLSGLRGGREGIFMFRTFSGMVLTSVNPLAAPMMVVSLVAGLALGRTSMTDEKKRELAEHRSQAKMAVSKYTDDVAFTVGRDLQAAVLRIQRQIRGHYSLRAEELHRSASEAVAAGTRAARQSLAEREIRAKAVDVELRKLAELEDSIRPLHDQMQALRR